MFNQSNQSLAIFSICLGVLLILFGTFIYTIVLRYKRKQASYYKGLNDLKISQENSLLQAQLDMQEYTFQTISREIHDNIGQKLSLVKLLLNTQTYTDLKLTAAQIGTSMIMISEAVNDLKDVSKSISSEVISNNGLVKAIEAEMLKLQITDQYKISFTTTGQIVFFDGAKDVIIFRIVQESLQNIIKHAKASLISIRLAYSEDVLKATIEDDGIGFKKVRTMGTGLANIKKRVAELNGTSEIISNENGTLISIEVPINLKPDA